MFGALFAVLSALAVLGEVQAYQNTTQSLQSRKVDSWESDVVEYNGAKPVCCGYQKKALDWDEDKVNEMRDKLCRDTKNQEAIQLSGRHGMEGYQVKVEGKPRTDYLAYFSDTTQTYNGDDCEGAMNAIIEGCIKQGYTLGSLGLLAWEDQNRDTSKGSYFGLWVPPPIGKKIRRGYPAGRSTVDDLEEAGLLDIVDEDDPNYPRNPAQVPDFDASKLNGPVEDIVLPSGYYRINDEIVYIDVEGDVFNPNRTTKRDEYTGFLPWAPKNHGLARRDRQPLRTTKGKVQKYTVGDTPNTNFGDRIANFFTEDQQMRKRSLARHTYDHDRIWNSCDQESSKSSYLLTAHGTFMADMEPIGPALICTNGCHYDEEHTEETTESFSFGIEAGVGDEMANVGASFGYGWEKKVTHSTALGCTWTQGKHQMMYETKMVWQRGLKMTNSGPHLPGKRKIHLNIVHGDAPQSDQSGTYNCDIGVCYYGPEKWHTETCVYALEHGMTAENQRWWGVCSEPTKDPRGGC